MQVVFNFFRVSITKSVSLSSICSDFSKRDASHGLFIVLHSSEQIIIPITIGSLFRKKIVCNFLNHTPVNLAHTLFIQSNRFGCLFKPKANTFSVGFNTHHCWSSSEKAFTEKQREKKKSV